MIVMFLTATFLGVSFSIFGLSFSLNSINRVITNTPKELFEISVPYINIGSTIHFDKNLLLKNLTSYYDDNLLQYVSHYSLNLYYYNKDDNSLCISSICQGVDVTIETSLLGFINYSRTMFYEIAKGALYEG